VNKNIVCAVLLFENNKGETKMKEKMKTSYFESREDLEEHLIKEAFFKKTSDNTYTRRYDIYNHSVVELYDDHYVFRVIESGSSWKDRGSMEYLFKYGKKPKRLGLKGDCYLISSTLKNNELYVEFGRRVVGGFDTWHLFKATSLINGKRGMWEKRSCKPEEWENFIALLKKKIEKMNEKKEDGKCSE
jgi:hypothetical protein